MAKKSPPKKLYRSENDKVIAGIAGGLAQYFNLDATLVRLFFVFTLLLEGSGVIAYLIMWIFIPAKSSLKLGSDAYIKKNTSELKEKAEEFAKKAQGMSTQNNSKFLLGTTLIIVGVSILLDNLGIWRIDFDFIWPLLLVVAGLHIIAGKK